MEGENPQKSKVESNLFKIPINKYENVMEFESAKRKKKEIVNLLNNHNKHHSEKEFEEIKINLYMACREGDLDLIKIYLSKTVENDSNGLQFKIDSTNRTASLFKVNGKTEDVIIPRTVEHESVEYLITSITGISCYLKTLKFVEDSAVNTIHQYAFAFSKIEEIFFPKSLKELKEGCSDTENLTKITISPSNSQFKIEEDKYLIGKSDSNKDEFGILLFGNRNIEEISIPSNIKIISSFAFQSCYNLTKVGIPPNSNLQTIGKYAFSETRIEEIFIPSKVSIICENAFGKCSNLTKVEFAANSNLQTIEQCAFSETKIKEIFIPSKVSKIWDNTFYKCYDLIKVEIPTNSNLQAIKKYAFAFSKIKEIIIPSKVTIISKLAFSFCENLVKIEISPNSNLQTIKENAFLSSNIKSISIPSKVSKICKNVFQYCKNLQIVEISEDSKLKSFPMSAFDKNINLIFMIPFSLEKMTYTYK